MNYSPSSIKSTEEDAGKAKTILSKDKNYYVRYLRNFPTVGLAEMPVRNRDGEIVNDLPWKKTKVICQGVPYACMIAVIDNGELKIGWSRRLDTKTLLETPDLHAMYLKILADSTIKDRVVTEDDDEYAEKFKLFCDTLMSVLSYTPAKDVEISFSKDAGRTTATLRALLDKITLTKKGAFSESSGPIPTDIARNLGWFIKTAERRLNMKAVNINTEIAAAA